MLNRMLSLTGAQILRIPFVVVVFNFGMLLCLRPFYPMLQSLK